MTTIFEGRPPPKQGLFKSEQGSFGFQVYKYIYIIYICPHLPVPYIYLELFGTKLPVANISSNDRPLVPNI